MKNTKICIVILSLAIFSVFIQPAIACHLKLVAVVPSVGNFKINHIEAMHVLDKYPNTMILVARNQGAYCGGGTPATVWKLNLKTGKSKLIQGLSLIQTSRGSLFESSDGTLFTGGGWCGWKPPYFSMDSGKTWSPAIKEWWHTAHPPNSTFSFIEFDGDVFAGTGYAPYHAQIYRWLGNAGAGNWELVFDIPPPRTIISSRAMAVYEGLLFVGSRIYGGGDCTNSVPVYISADGKKFQPTTGIPPCFTVWHLSKVGDQLVALTSQFDDDTEAYLYRWNKNIEAWELIGPYPLGLHAGIGFKKHFILSNRGFLYSYGQASCDTSKGIYRSVDIGRTWEQIAVLENPDAIAAMIHKNFLYVTTQADEDGTADIYRIYLKPPKVELLWEDQVNGIANGPDYAFAVATDGRRVFSAGRVMNIDTRSDFTIRAYNAKTGKLLWQDQISGPDAYSYDTAKAILVKDNRVFVGGTIENEATGGGGDFTLRTYDVKKGELLWQDQIGTGAYHEEEVTAIASKGKRVFAAGNLGKNGIECFTVRAYSRKTGKLLWQDQVSGSYHNSATVRAITADKNRVYAAGMVQNEVSYTDFIVRAYNSKTGKLLWQDQVNGASFIHDDGAYAIAAKGSRVFVAGQIDANFTVRAYNSNTGTLLWQDQIINFEGQDFAQSIAVEGNKIYAAGMVVDAYEDHFFTIRAYSCNTGKLLWQDQIKGEATAVSAKGNLVYAAGRIQSANIADFAVRVYNSRTGKLLWQDQVDGSDENSVDYVNAISLKGSKMVVSGSLENYNQCADYTVRTYEVK